MQRTAVGTFASLILAGSLGIAAAPTASSAPLAPAAVTAAPLAIAPAPAPAIAVPATTHLRKGRISPWSKTYAKGQPRRVRVLLYTAERHLGQPYRFGANGPNSWDCSSFTRHVYSAVGLSLPRVSGAQAARGYRVSRSAARAGDLVSWGGHVAIMVNRTHYVAAHKSGTRISVKKLYGSPTFRRLIR